MENARPADEAQLYEVVRWALAARQTLCIRGGGTKRGFGLPFAADCELAMDGCEGISGYEPSEMVMSAKAGTPLTAVEAELARHGQQLAFEPPRLSSLFGCDDRRETIGGVFLGNLSGPRRFLAGAARDFVLGSRAVNGRGEVWKSGGKVIKNVTGYDLSRLLAGSWGTLSIVSELTFKVLPAPQRALTLCVSGLAPAAGFRLLRSVAGSPMVASGLAFVPEHLVATLPALAGRSGSLTAIRLEGSGSSVRERANGLSRLLPADAARFELEHDESLALWRAVRDVAPFAGANHPVIAKVSLPPVAAERLVEILSAFAECRWFADAAGAWIWLSSGSSHAAEMWSEVRNFLATNGGNAAIWRAPEAFKTAHGVFSGKDARLQALQRNVKQSFDPAALFNPGRLFPVN